MNKYDVIVIGAGNGGLSAAATTSIAGLKTLVLERHNLPGGSATSFVRGRFEFESALHELCDLGTEENPGTVRKLFDQYDCRMDWYLEDHLFHLIVPGHTDVVLPTGIEPFCQAMEKAVPGCYDSVKALMDLGRTAVEAQAYAMSPKASKLVMMTKYADFLRMAGATTRQGMNALGVPEKAQYILETYWCYLGAPADDLDFLTTVQMIYKYVVGHPGQPADKSHRLSLTLADTILRHGGDIWYNCEVSKILIENGKAKGVIVEGKEIRADHIIANCSPSTVMGRMIDPSIPRPEYPLKLANARHTALELETMYVGLTRSAQELGIHDYSTLIMSDEDPDLQFQKANGKDKGVFIANCLNCMIPNASPKGTCTLFFTTFGDEKFWAGVKPQDYYKVKEARMKDWVDYYEKCTGITIRPYIEEITFASPATFCRYLNSPNGTPYGYQVTWLDNIINRLTSMDKEQIYKNLRLTGAACENIDGYNLCYLNGNIQGRKTIQDAKEDK
ncbi:MAG: NAD(P)/FAD-dependent oxidoreductase [Lactimicrobium sp.]|jgi:phytoene dehydrogenase-like protein|uniref:phytoene desaturase family protein n=1 Tax=Lactimicrobium sp. TaxID=2563780 RepID=UPI002F358D17